MGAPGVRIVLPRVGSPKALIGWANRDVIFRNIQNLSQNISADGQSKLLQDLINFGYVTRPVQNIADLQAEDICNWIWSESKLRDNFGPELMAENPFGTSAILRPLYRGLQSVYEHPFQSPAMAISKGVYWGVSKAVSFVLWAGKFEPVGAIAGYGVLTGLANLGPQYLALGLATSGWVLAARLAKKADPTKLYGKALNVVKNQMYVPMLIADSLGLAAIVHNSNLFFQNVQNQGFGDWETAGLAAFCIHFVGKFISDKSKELVIAYGGQVSPGNLSVMKTQTRWAAASYLFDKAFLMIPVPLLISGLYTIGARMGYVGLAALGLPLMSLVWQAKGSFPRYAAFVDAKYSLRRLAYAYRPIIGLLMGAGVSYLFGGGAESLLAYSYGMITGSVALYAAMLHQSAFSMNTVKGEMLGLKASSKPTIGDSEIKASVQKLVNMLNRTDMGLGDSSFGLLLTALLGIACPTLYQCDAMVYDKSKMGFTTDPDTERLLIGMIRDMIKVKCNDPAACANTKAALISWIIENVRKGKLPHDENAWGRDFKKLDDWIESVVKLYMQKKKEDEENAKQKDEKDKKNDASQDVAAFENSILNWDPVLRTGLIDILTFIASMKAANVGNNSGVDLGTENALVHWVRTQMQAGVLVRCNFADDKSLEADLKKLNINNDNDLRKWIRTKFYPAVRNIKERELFISWVQTKQRAILDAVLKGNGGQNPINEDGISLEEKYRRVRENLRYAADEIDRMEATILSEASKTGWFDPKSKGEYLEALRRHMNFKAKIWREAADSIDPAINRVIMSLELLERILMQDVRLEGYDPDRRAQIVYTARKALAGDPKDVRKEGNLATFILKHGMHLFEIAFDESAEQPYPTIDEVAGTWTRILNPDFSYLADPKSFEGKKYIWVKLNTVLKALDRKDGGPTANLKEHTSTSRTVKQIENHPSLTPGFVKGRRHFTARINDKNILFEGSGNGEYYFVDDPAKQSMAPEAKGLILRDGDGKPVPITELDKLYEQERLPGSSVSITRSFQVELYDAASVADKADVTFQEQLMALLVRNKEQVADFFVQLAYKIPYGKGKKNEVKRADGTLDPEKSDFVVDTQMILYSGKYEDPYGAEYVMPWLMDPGAMRQIYRVPKDAVLQGAEVEMRGGKLVGLKLIYSGIAYSITRKSDWPREDIEKHMGLKPDGVQTINATDFKESDNSLALVGDRWVIWDSEKQKYILGTGDRATWPDDLGRNRKGEDNYIVNAVLVPIRKAWFRMLGVKMNDPDTRRSLRVEEVNTTGKKYITADGQFTPEPPKEEEVSKDNKPHFFVTIENPNGNIRDNGTGRSARIAGFDLMELPSQQSVDDFIKGFNADPLDYGYPKGSSVTSGREEYDKLMQLHFPEKVAKSKGATEVKGNIGVVVVEGEEKPFVVEIGELGDKGNVNRDMNQGEHADSVIEMVPAGNELKVTELRKVNEGPKSDASVIFYTFDIAAMNGKIVDVSNEKGLYIRQDDMLSWLRRADRRDCVDKKGNSTVKVVPIKVQDKKGKEVITGYKVEITWHPAGTDIYETVRIDGKYLLDNHGKPLLGNKELGITSLDDIFQADEYTPETIGLMPTIDSYADGGLKLKLQLVHTYYIDKPYAGKEEEDKRKEFDKKIAGKKFQIFPSAAYSAVKINGTWLPMNTVVTHEGTLKMDECLITDAETVAAVNEQNRVGFYPNDWVKEQDSYFYGLEETQSPRDRVRHGTNFGLNFFKGLSNEGICSGRTYITWWNEFVNAATYLEPTTNPNFIKPCEDKPTQGWSVSEDEKMKQVQRMYGKVMQVIKVAFDTQSLLGGNVMVAEDDIVAWVNQRKNRYPFSERLFVKRFDLFLRQALGKQFSGIIPESLLRTIPNTITPRQATEIAAGWGWYKYSVALFTGIASLIAYIGSGGILQMIPWEITIMTTAWVLKNFTAPVAYARQMVSLGKKPRQALKMGFITNPSVELTIAWDQFRNAFEQWVRRNQWANFILTSGGGKAIGWQNFAFSSICTAGISVALYYGILSLLAGPTIGIAAGTFFLGLILFQFLANLKFMIGLIDWKASWKAKEFKPKANASPLSEELMREQEKIDIKATLEASVKAKKLDKKTVQVPSAKRPLIDEYRLLKTQISAGVPLPAASYYELFRLRTKIKQILRGMKGIDKEGNVAITEHSNEAGVISAMLDTYSKIETAICMKAERELKRDNSNATALLAIKMIVDDTTDYVVGYYAQQILARVGKLSLLKEGK